MLARLKYQTLKLTPKLHVGFDNKVKNPTATVVFIHGIAADWRSFDEVLKQIKTSERFNQVRLIAIDTLGFGKSPSGDFIRYTMDNEIRSIEKTISRLKINSPLYVVGHSMGCILAVKYAEKHTVTGLVLSGPPFMLPEEQSALAEKMFNQTASKQRVKLDGLPASDKQVKKGADFINMLSSSKTSMILMKNIVLRGDGWQVVNKLNIPIKIIRGKFDSLTLKTNSINLAKNHPNITYEEVESGHDIKGPMIGAITESLADLLQ